MVKILSGCGNAAAEAFIDCLKFEHVGRLSLQKDKTLLLLLPNMKEYVAAILKVFEDMIALRE